MIIYELSYSSGDGEIKIEEIQCKETANSYCWLRRRLSKDYVNVADVYGGDYHTSVSAHAYASSLDFSTEFIYLISQKIEKTLINAEKNLNNMKLFLEENKKLLEEYREDNHWKKIADFRS